MPHPRWPNGQQTTLTASVRRNLQHQNLPDDPGSRKTTLKILMGIEP
jgi:hypothetical protein